MDGCRYCLQTFEESGEQTFWFCQCTGGELHQTCLNHWINTKSIDHCDICRTPYLLQTIYSPVPLKKMCVNLVWAIVSIVWDHKLLEMWSYTLLISDPQKRARSQWYALLFVTQGVSSLYFCLYFGLSKDCPWDALTIKVYKIMVPISWMLAFLFFTTKREYVEFLSTVATCFISGLLIQPARLRLYDVIWEKKYSVVLHPIDV